MLTFTFGTCAEEPIDLSGLITIDSVKDPGDAVANMSHFYVGHLGHLTVGEALQNVATAKHGGSANIIGHGHQGIVNTGRGSDFDRPVPCDKFLGVSNEPVWSAIISDLQLAGRLSALTICACDTGAGQKGATLLQHLADALQAPMCAPAGKVWADREDAPPVLRDCARWQMARPGQSAPEPIDPPTFHRLVDLQFLKIFDRYQIIEVPLTQVRSFHWQGMSEVSVLDQIDVTLTGPQAIAAAKLVQFDAPFFSPAAPLTLRTGECTLVFEREKQEIARQFWVHNDSLLQDTEYPAVFYDLDLKSISQM